jgi:hypothetical protein
MQENSDDQVALFVRERTGRRIFNAQALKLSRQRPAIEDIRSKTITSESDAQAHRY